MRTIIVALALLAAVCPLPSAARDVRFERTVLDKRFVSEGVAVADVNRDGKPDVLAGNLWYAAPDWTPREIAAVRVFDGAAGYSNCFLSFAADVNRDGWPDQIVFGMPGDPAVWRENPRGADRPWAEHPLYENACNETQVFADLLGNRHPVPVFPSNGLMAWYEPASDPNGPFVRHVVGLKDQPGTQRFAHGLGVGDVNGDRRADVITPQGWYEAPADRRTGEWRFVPAQLGPDCAQMLVYDVNADGLPDVLSSSAHGKGVWWYEQRRGTAGPAFTQHEIDATISQTHAIVLADINGDGVMDLVTGKRFWAHGPDGDVDTNAPAVVCWYELTRSGRNVRWTRHVIDENSGVGTQFTVADVNRDGLRDVVVANKKGVHLFTQVRRSGR